MSRCWRIAPLVVAIVALLAPPAAQADFGLVPGSLSVAARNEDGTVTLQAGGHPYTYEVDFALKTGADGATEGGEARSFVIDLPPGLIGNPQAVPRCPRALFEGLIPQCPAETQIGVLRPTIEIGLTAGPIYNMVPPPGVAAQLGFSVFNNNAIQNATVRSEEGYGVRINANNLPVEVRAVTAKLWGTPADPGHDDERGPEAGTRGEVTPSGAPQQAFLTMPTSCEEVPRITVRADSKLAPGIFDEQSTLQLDAGGNPAAMSGCEAVPFDPRISAQPTTRLAENSTGLDFELKLPSRGLLAPGEIAETVPQKAVVTLPEGVTVNPSAAEGIAVCSEAQYRAMSPTSAPGVGCPEASKLGSLVGHSPLIDEAVEGSLYLAEPYENPTNSLIGLYIVAKAGERGVLVKQAGSIEPDPRTGQLISTFDNLPPLPYSDFTLHFREGARAPLVSPPTCGTYTTTAELTPFSTPDQPYTATSSFTIDKGVDGGPCPAGVPPFGPGFQAGSLNNAAGAFSPFYMRLTRADGEQDMTKFSSILPPGVLGKLAGVSKCPDSAVATAKSKTGLQEIASPSCPASSQIGRVMAGAGVGSIQTYVDGKVYLGGPYNGAPLSVIVITPAVAGPFDVGTVVVREALTLNPVTAEVEVDGAASDPIPNILAGIPLKVRDLRVYVDRDNFTLNPTSCDSFQTKATLFGGYLNVFSSADDVPISLADRFQAADCANLGYMPGLNLRLKGGTKRGGHPGLLATYKARKGNANTKGIVVRLPRSAFLDQAHIRTICTRVQFASDNCPKGAQYGYIKAFTPLLDEPLEGPVWLRSSNHKLPDLVFDLHGLVDVEVATRIDSARGGIRASIEDAPDAPLTKVVLRMQGGKKGLIVNSRNLCGKRSRANVEFSGQNGKQSKFNPVMKADCGGKRKAKKRRR